MRLLLASLALLLPLPLGARAGQPPVRVNILSRHAPRSLEIRPEVPGTSLRLRVEGVDGRVSDRLEKRVALRCEAGEGLFVEEQGALSVEIESKSKKDMEIHFGDNLKRRYKGRLYVEENKGKCLIVAEVQFEDYVDAVACAELGTEASPEALKAQAVVVRGYATRERGRHASDGYDFCDLTHCQVFAGLDRCSASQKKALEQVRGKVLLYDGTPAQVAYFSTCGGHTADARDVWGATGDLPYLRGVEDGSPRANCARSDHWRWRFEVGTEELCGRLSSEFSQLGSGPCSIQVEDAGKEGWVRWLRVAAKGRVRLAGSRFHLLLGRWYGWNRFKSGRFRLEQRGRSTVFLGRGLGHGVGLCQHGAMGLARKGKTYEQILFHYFPGTSLGDLP